MISRSQDYSELRLATLEIEEGHYLDLVALMALVPQPNHSKLWQVIKEHWAVVAVGRGSSHNHQAWEGGYLNHVAETMNIACQLYSTLGGLRKLPFALHEALEVMFLHDIEKPFKHDVAIGELMKQSVLSYNGTSIPATKENRKKFRADIIKEYRIALTPEQENALKYVEGIPDSEYKPGERVMGELAAFCHCCDILSARLWHDKGANVPAPEWE